MTRTPAGMQEVLNLIDILIESLGEPDIDWAYVENLARRLVTIARDRKDTE